MTHDDVDVPPGFIHPAITISETSFSANNKDKAPKSLYEIAKIKSEEKISFPSDINDTKVNIKIEPGLGLPELSAGPARTASTPPTS